MIKYIILTLVALVVMGCSPEVSQSPANPPKTSYFKLNDIIPVNYWKVSINKVYETNRISSFPYATFDAEKGTKYVFVKMEVENTAKQTMLFRTDELVKVVDSKNNEFEPWIYGISAYPDVLDYNEFSPSIPKAGYLIYQIPEKNSVKFIKFLDKSGDKLLKL